MFIEYLRRSFTPNDTTPPTLLEKVIGLVIVLSIVAVVLETEPNLFEEYSSKFEIAERFFLTFFVLEYTLRLIFCSSDNRYSGLSGRIKYAFSPYALIDAMAILPSLLFLADQQFMLLRAARLIRLARIARLLRDNLFLLAFMRAFFHARAALFASLAVSIFVLFMGAVLMYLAEADAQPDTFGSIPRALWWAMATLTTVGYGDAYPITAIGKILASIIAILGIGIVAMPAGVIAAHFSKELDTVRNDQQ